MSQLISDKAVYRTAPATPGLLNTLWCRLIYTFQFDASQHLHCTINSTGTIGTFALFALCALLAQSTVFALFSVHSHLVIDVYIPEDTLPGVSDVRAVQWGESSLDIAHFTQNSE